MKCVITGHTSGLGKYLYNYFLSNGWEVLGMSRSNGYDISVDRDKIINQSLDCDLFINNASSEDSQLELLKSLCKKVSKIVTMGTAGTEFTNIWGKQYTYDKKQLEDSFKLISMNPNVADLLYLKISFLETTYNLKKENRLDSDYTISYHEIAKAIDFWLSNPKIRQLDFNIKLTDYTVQTVKQLTGKNDLVDKILDNIDILINDDSSN